MYEELIKRLRLCAEGFNCRRCEYEFVNGCRSKLNKDAADAIEELEAAANDYKDQISALRTAVKRQSHIIQAKDRDSQRAIDAYPRWISVEERLPKPYEDVLLRFPHNQAAGFHDGDCGWGVYSGDGMYTDVAPEEMHPTHWAKKLPEPPKEEI